METCCRYIYYERSYGIAFIGYDSTELNNCIIIRHEANTHLQKPIDTVYGRSHVFQFRGDTAYATQTIDSKLTQFVVTPNIDLEIVFTDTHYNHTITGQNKNGQPDKECFLAERCSPGAGQPIIATIVNVHVDNELITHHNSGGNFFSDYPWYLVFLKKE